MSQCQKRNVISFFKSHTKSVLLLIVFINILSIVAIEHSVTLIGEEIFCLYSYSICFTYKLSKTQKKRTGIISY